MHATRRLLLSQQGNNSLFNANRTKKFIIPTETFWDIAYNSIQGFWTLLTDNTAHKRYEKYVNDNIIKDTVLNQARYGPLLTMSLFYNIDQNPFFNKYNVNIKEFVEAVGPAIEVFQDTLGQLVQQDMLDNNNNNNNNKINNEEKSTTTTNENNDDSSVDNDKESVVTAQQQSQEQPLTSSTANVAQQSIIFDNILNPGENIWRKNAKDDPNSLAGRFIKMVTDQNLDEHYYGAKLFQVLTSGTQQPQLEYVPGSGIVNQIALLSARAMEIGTVEEKIDQYPEFAASEDITLPVAARMDVLYEITQTYRLPKSQKYPGTFNYNQSKILNNTSSSLDENKLSSSKEKEKSNNKDEEQNTRTETMLAVAVFEGWLHGGRDKDLRWKVAMVRDAYEFP